MWLFLIYFASCFCASFYCFLPIPSVCIFLSMWLWREMSKRKVLLVSEIVLEDSGFRWTFSIVPFWLLSMLCNSNFWNPPRKWQGAELLHTFGQRQLVPVQSSQCPSIVMCYKSFYDNDAFFFHLRVHGWWISSIFSEKIRSISELYLTIGSYSEVGFWWLW